MSIEQAKAILTVCTVFLGDVRRAIKDERYDDGRDLFLFLGREMNRGAAYLRKDEEVERCELQKG